MAIATLHHKHVLITGAASGIGRAAALAFAREGAHIHAADLNAGALQTLETEVQALGRQCTSYLVNMADETAVREFAEQVNNRIGALDVLINNAGIGYLGQFLHSDLAHWQRLINVNLMGVVHGCYYFLPAMIAAGGERQVLNVASAAGIYPSPTMGAYAASKHAVFGFTEVLKMELAATPVGVTTVCPGIINTPITRTPGAVSASVTEEQVSRLRAYYDAKGCSPDVVAEAMVRAVLSGEDILLVGPYAKLINFMRRLSIKWMRSLVIKDARKIGYL
jgi:NAD(P)-dependent dehydrogenase (short-subunit alcohol dehydrogenase family)